MPLRPRLLRGIALALAALLALAAPARAQPASAPASASSPGQPVSADELQQLVDTLDDPVARQKLVTQLQALIAAQRGQQQQSALASPATAFDTLSDQFDTMATEILSAAKVVINLPRLFRWLERQVESEPQRAFWLTVGTQLALILTAGLIANWVADFLLRRVQRKVAALRGATTGARLVNMLLGFVIAAVPVLAFAAASSATVPFVDVNFGTREVARVLIAAILWTRLVLAAVRVALLAPAAQESYGLGGETRQYLYIWARRFAGWAVYGFSFASAAWWLGVPSSIHALILRSTILVLAMLAIIFVLQNRTAVSDWLRGGREGRGTWRVIRHRVADTWHVLAIIYIVGSFGVYVVNVSGGYYFLIQATVETVVVLLASALLVRFFERLSQRGFALSSETKSLYPTLETRANRYLPALSFVIATVVYVSAALTLLQVWGVRAFDWLDTETSRRTTGTVVTTGIVLVAAVIAWELFSSAIERYLHAGSASVARSARIRTLLPVLRTAVMVVLVVMVGLIVLSEIGVNIAPLLAGAGVVGLAVGFASQALLKDLIIGLIILAEDTLAVGEVVDVGKGAGVVEAITMRAMRLRDASGTLLTIPFSEVTTIRNMTRDFAYAVHDIGVVYREDPDRVIAVLREVAAEMAADPEWAARILGPLDVVGLERFTDSAQMIRVRLKTAPLQQWGVQYEFNRRMKKAFDAHGIEMPAANQTHYLATPPA
ncbi:MAG TPA: mechanosensitive ion channel domain-containing protein [Stellaceae bacterium]|nr:mechanosensitive ion channel domain-containing protein [Stellaceae bacterium]